MAPPPGSVVRTFGSAAELRRWLERHGAAAAELWVGLHKKGSGLGGPSYAEAVDEALCVGWIDGVRHGVDEQRYAIRFTPRKPTSIWSRINLGHVARLTEAGRMRPAGLAAFQARLAHRTAVYAFEQPPKDFPPALRRRFRAEPRAWAFWEAQPPGYRRIAIYWVVSAKREETRHRRLATLIDDSGHGRRLAHLARPTAASAPLATARRASPPAPRRSGGRPPASAPRGRGRRAP